MLPYIIVKIVEAFVGLQLNRLCYHLKAACKDVAEINFPLQTVEPSFQKGPFTYDVHTDGGWLKSSQSYW